MTYADLLQQPEWFEKCAEILRRDQYRCQKCGKIGFHNSPAFMEVDDLTDIYKLVNVNKYFIGKLNLTFQELLEAGFIESIFKLKNTRDRIDLPYYGHLSIHEAIASKIQTIGDFNVYKLVLSKPSCNNEEELLDRLDVNQAIIDQNPSLYIKKELAKVNFQFMCLCTKSKLDNTDSPISLRIFKFEEVLADKYIVSIYRSLNSKWNVVLNIIYKNYLYSIEILNYSTVKDYYENKAFIPGINIHHNYYIQGLMPWKYDDKALTTLCENCHKEFHKHNQVPIYSDYTKDESTARHPIICPRCGGSGYLPQYSYYMNGVCFLCGGEGVLID